MTFSDFNSHTNPLFIDLKLLKVRDIIKSQQLKLVSELFINVLPDDLHSLFDLSRDIHTTNLELKSAQKYLLYILSIKTVTCANKSIKYHCAELWNSTFRNGTAIDEDIKNNVLHVNQILNVSQFKRILKKHFLYNYSLNSY